MGLQLLQLLSCHWAWATQTGQQGGRDEAGVSRPPFLICTLGEEVSTAFLRFLPACLFVFNGGLGQGAPSQGVKWGLPSGLTQPHLVAHAETQNHQMPDAQNLEPSSTETSNTGFLDNCCQHLFNKHIRCQVLVKHSK